MPRLDICCIKNSVFYNYPIANMPNISAGLSSINLTGSDKRKIAESLHKDILRRSKKRLCKFSRNVIYN